MIKFDSDYLYFAFSFFVFMKKLTGAEVLLPLAAALPCLRAPPVHRVALPPPPDHHHGHPHGAGEAHGGSDLGMGGVVEGLPVHGQHLVPLHDGALPGGQAVGEHLVDLGRGGNEEG